MEHASERPSVETGLEILREHDLLSRGRIVRQLRREIIPKAEGPPFGSSIACLGTPGVGKPHEFMSVERLGATVARDLCGREKMPGPQVVPQRGEGIREIRGVDPLGPHAELLHVASLGEAREFLYENARFGHGSGTSLE